MGSVYQRGPNNFWIKWREGGRIRYDRGYETREDAEKVRAKIVADIAAGRAGLPPDPRGLPSLAELADTWLEERKATHRAVADDRCRWKLHLKPIFGGMKPPEVTEPAIREFIVDKLAAGMNPATVGHCVRLLSTFFSDLIPKYVLVNPVSAVSKKTRRLYRPTTDPKDTAFLESLADVTRVYQALPAPVNVAFVVGAFAGLRTGEILGLDWRDVDLAAKRITVRRQVRHGELAGLKDDETRRVTIQAALLPVLSEWKLATGGAGLLFKPKHPTRGGRPDRERPAAFMRPNTLRAHLTKALTKLKLPPVSWYGATRHTFASHWILQGGQKEKLADQMGHSNTIVTDRYAHLRPDLYREEDYRVLAVDLNAGCGKVLAMRPTPTADGEKGPDGYDMATPDPGTPDRATVTG
jgi:integrase